MNATLNDSTLQFQREHYASLAVCVRDIQYMQNT